MSNDSDPDISISLPMLSKLGKMKFGPGVMGRSVWLAGFLLVFGLVAMTILKDVIWAAIPFGLLSLGAAVYVVRKAFAHSDKHPLHALLDSGELLQALQLEHAAGDKSIMRSSATVIQNSETLKALPSKDEGGK